MGGGKLDKSQPECLKSIVFQFQVSTESGPTQLLGRTDVDDLQRRKFAFNIRQPEPEPEPDEPRIGAGSDLFSSNEHLDQSDEWKHGRGHETILVHREFTKTKIKKCTFFFFRF